MRNRFIVPGGLNAGSIGYGAMALSLEGRPSRDDSLQLLLRLLGEGVRFFDTADSYGTGPSDMHHNERLLVDALKIAGMDLSNVCLATKGGALQTGRGWKIEGSPDYLYLAICESFEALGGNHPIPLWQHHWPDPRYSIEQMMEPVSRAVQEGLVSRVGVGNYNVAQIKEARGVVDVVSVQNQYNLWHREPEQDGVLEYCEQEGLVFLPWRPMGGLGLAQRLKEITQLTEIARRHGISEQRLIIAWQLSKSKCILPIPGSSRLENILDCLAAKEVRLDQVEITRLNSISAADLPLRERPAAWEGSPGLAG